MAQLLFRSFSTFLLMFFSLCCLGQTNFKLTGKVVDETHQPLIGTSVLIEGTSYGVATDNNGFFSISGESQNENIKVKISFIGYKEIIESVPLKGNLDLGVIQMMPDYLSMDEILVTGTFNKASKLESSVAVTTLNKAFIKTRQQRGTGDLLLAVPGTYVDNSAGEVDARIFPRGMAAGSSTGTGFRYVSLQEDGLPIMNTLLGFAQVDMFHRYDATVERVEALRGGSTSVSSANSPGGIFNFISRQGSKDFTGELTFKGGLQGSERTYSRIDFNANGPLGKTFFYNIGGFYRHDEGARDLPFTANKGGQAKGNLLKTFKNGFVKVYGKFLQDRVTSFQYLPIRNIETAIPFEGFDLNKSALFPELKTTLPNLSEPGTDLKNPPQRNFDARDLIAAQNYSLGIEFEFDLFDNWTINNKARYSYFNQDYHQFAGNIMIPVNGVLSQGARELFPEADSLGNPVYQFYNHYDAVSGELLFRNSPDPTQNVNSIGDFLMAFAAVDLENESYDFSDLLTFSKEGERNQFTAGIYLAKNTTDIYWSADAILTTFEATPRLVYSTHPNPNFGDYKLTQIFPEVRGELVDQELLEITDEDGVLAYSSTAFTRMNMDTEVASIFFNNVYELTSSLSIDAGLRLESIRHKGEKSGFDRALTGRNLEELALFGRRNPETGELEVAYNENGQPDLFKTISGAIPYGLDGDYTTLSDYAASYNNGTIYSFNFRYNYWTGSAGANYKLNSHSAVYSRLSRGIKVPDMDFYAQNFINREVQKGAKEEIIQVEAGYKFNLPFLSLFATGFYSKLNNVPYQVRVNSGAGLSYFTPTTFNESRTIGFELESFMHLSKSFSIRSNLTLQDPRWLSFTMYNDGRLPTDRNELDPNGQPYDWQFAEVIETFENTIVRDVPRVVLDITPHFRYKKAALFFNWRYTGKRAYNNRNAAFASAYSVFNVGGSLSLTKKMLFSANCRNLFNSSGLLNFADLVGLGVTREAITSENLKNYEANGIPIFARPILPRMVTASLTYKI